MKTNKEKQKEVLLAVLKMIDFQDFSKSPLIPEDILKLKKRKALIRSFHTSYFGITFNIYVVIELPKIKVRLITPNLMNAEIDYNFKY